MKLNNKGFTLVEVLAVVVILTILGGVAIVGVLSSINSSKEASYKIMTKNIVVASQMMYEETSNKGIMNNSLSKTYEYNELGQTEIEINFVSIYDENNQIKNNVIRTNLQTLVSNGYLDGINNYTKHCNDENCKENSNKKIILNPKESKDIGECNIVIYKEANSIIVKNDIYGATIIEESDSSDDITYSDPINKINNNNNSNCPSDADYEKVKKND